LKSQIQNPKSRIPNHKSEKDARGWIACIGFGKMRNGQKLLAWAAAGVQ